MLRESAQDFATSQLQIMEIQYNLDYEPEF